MDNLELRDIVVSAVVLAIAFGIAFNGGIERIDTFSLGIVIIAFVAVSLSFILHELAHRFLARRYGFYAQYKMWPQGLVIAMLFSLLGFVFAAPGAVMIHPKADLWGSSQTLTKKKMGLIALVGPLTNIALAGIFTALFILYPLEIFTLAISINVWLALFNMLPLAILDGAKVFHWNKRIWVITFAVILAMFAAAAVL